MSIRGRKCADGTISYKVRFTWQGREIWEHAGKNRRDAERLEARRRKEVLDGTYVPPAQSKATTVGEHLRAWIEVRDNRNADTECGYVRRYVFTREWFMQMPIMDVRPRHIIALVDELRKQISAKTQKVLAGKTVANIYGVLRTAFRDARIAELITEDPCVLPRGKLKRLGKVVRLPYGWPALLTLTGDLVQAERRIWNALAFYTGMREGEVCGRRWRDWDRNSEPLGSLSITTQYNDQPLKTEITSERPRKAPVHPRLADLLAWWWSEGFEFVYLRRPTTDDFIVPNRRMGMANHTKSSAYKAWIKSTEEAGVTNLSLHSTRHTFITLARRGGADKFLIEKITHNSKGDIVDQYTHAEWAPLCGAVLSLRSPAESDAPRAADRAAGEKSSKKQVEAPGIEPDKFNNLHRFEHKFAA